VITLYTMRPILYPPPKKKKTTIADICPHNLTVTLPWPYRLYNCTYLLVYSSIGTRESSTVTRSAFDNDQRNVTAFRPISEAAHSWSYNKHTDTHPFNGPFSGTTQVSRYQKGNTNLVMTEAKDMAVASAGPYASRHLAADRQPHYSVLQAGCPSCRPTNSVKAL